MSEPAPARSPWPRRVADSVFRVGWPRTDRARAQAMLSSFFLHLHAPRVRRHSLHAWYTLGLGVVSAYLFFILTFTGIVLMLWYTPSPVAAYRSIKDLQFVVPYGGFLRNLHRWAGHAMVAVVCLHMCRVFFTGAYKAPRQFNWQIGLALLVLTLALSFTGYLLPWDQLAFWAVTVGTSMATYVPMLGTPLRYLLLGGDTVGPGALLRFYVLHCAVLPATMLLLVVLHVFRVRRDGLSAPAVVANAHTQPAGAAVEGARLVPAWPHLLCLEVLLLLATLVVLQVLALAVNAPLEEIADAARTPNPARAPWYFLGLQELVHHSAVVGGVLAPAVVFIALVVLPYIDTSPRGIGTWFARDRRAVNIAFGLLVFAALALTAIGAWFRGPQWAWAWPWRT
jgi:quinol-cytochrome oxidoreductase complex cytochrome b subunit